jgi:hypothetical protein
VSDIGILNDPWSLAFVLLILDAPGLPIGGLIGARAWRRNCILGALLGALLGFALWLAGWMLWNDVI